MATTARDPILVVGGGLGGAAVALALALNGFRVRLIEQAPEFGVIGYGIQLGPKHSTCLIAWASVKRY